MARAKQRTIFIHSAIYSALKDYLSGDETIINEEWAPSELGELEVTPAQKMRELVEEPYMRKLQRPAFDFIEQLDQTEYTRVRIGSYKSDIHAMDDEEFELRLTMGLLAHGVVLVNPYHDQQPVERGREELRRNRKK